MRGRVCEEDGVVQKIITTKQSKIRLNNFKKTFLNQEQLKTHKNTWHNHPAITFTYFIKTKKFQKEKCRESYHEQLSFTTYKQKTKGSRSRGKGIPQPDLEKRENLRAFGFLFAKDLSAKTKGTLPLLAWLQPSLSHSWGVGVCLHKTLDGEKVRHKTQACPSTHTHVDTHAIGYHKCFLLFSMQGNTV